MTVGHALLAFSIAAGLLTITPGLDTALVMRTAAVEGKGRAILAAVGICSGLFVLALAVSAGLGALVAMSQMTYNALRLAGACYLIYLGARILLRRHVITHNSDPAARGSTASRNVSVEASNWFGRGFLTNILRRSVRFT